MKRKNEEKKILHTGYIIESLLILFEEFNEKAKELSPKKLFNIRNQFAVAHISSSGEKVVNNIAETIPSDTLGKVVSYCIIKNFESQGPFIGICIECIDKTFYSILYDNGKNNLYRCITHMKNNPKEFIILDNPIEIKLRKYIMYDE